MIIWGLITKKDLLGIQRLKRPPKIRKSPCKALFNVSLSDMSLEEDLNDYRDFAQKIPNAGVYALSASTLEVPGIIEVLVLSTFL